MTTGGLPVYRVSHHWGVIRRWFHQGNASGVTGRRMFWPSQSRDRQIGFFGILRARWAGVCRDCFPLCLEVGGLGGRCGRPGGNSRSPTKLSDDLVVTGNDMVSGGETSVVEKLNGYSGDLAGQRQDQDAPLPGDELNPRVGPRWGAVRTNRQKGYRNSVPPQDVTGEAFELDNAAVLTPAIARAASSSIFAGPRLTWPEYRSRPLLKWNFRPLLRIYHWPMTSGGCPHLSVLVNRSGLLPGRVPCLMLR